MQEFELNTNGLDEGISNAIGCGIPPVCSNTKMVFDKNMNCIKIGKKQICSGGLKTVTNQDCIDKKKSHAECVKREGNIFQNIGKDIKKATEKAKSDFKKTTQNVKKKLTSLKEKVGKIGKKFRNKFRALMRKDILFKIKNNIHGIAVRAYPAIASDSEIKKSRYKFGYVPKSKKTYNQLLSQWIKIGGTKEELDAAIRQGASKRRFAKNPYKSFNGWNDSYAFYQNFCCADGNEESSTEGDASTEEVPTEEEKQKGIRGFFAWILSIFKKNNADENPYEEGTSEAGDFGADKNEDKGNEPSESEINTDIMNEIMSTSESDDAGGESDESRKASDSEDDKILGIPKTGFWIGVGVLGLAAISLTVYLIKKK